MCKSKNIHIFKISTTAACLLTLTACASYPDVLEVDVQSFASHPALSTPQNYELQWLPSQDTNSHFAHLEAVAQAALIRVGLHRTSAYASPQVREHTLTVQLGTTAVQARHCPKSPEEPEGAAQPRLGWSIGWGWWNAPIGLGFSWSDFARPMNCYSAKMIIRNAKNQTIVYESTAQFESSTTVNADIWGVLFDAALRDFPQGHPKKRSIIINLKNHAGFLNVKK